MDEEIKKIMSDYQAELDKSVAEYKVLHKKIERELAKQILENLKND